MKSWAELAPDIANTVAKTAAIALQHRIIAHRCNGSVSGQCANLNISCSTIYRSRRIPALAIESFRRRSFRTINRQPEK
jgi:deoxycytidylate deaminase